MTSTIGEGRILRHVTNGRWDDWARQVAMTGHCARPVRLRGHVERVDSTTGATSVAFDSASLPDGLLYVRCGNRRASRCGSCSHEYQGDYWHVVNAGVSGGDKGVPAEVSRHRLIFLTLTAPSFGAVHNASGEQGNRRCRPRRGNCSHGQPLGCWEQHDHFDERLGTPLCQDCYDYDAHVLWNWHAGELWRRFTIRLRRTLAQTLGLTEASLHRRCRVQYAKVAEYQRRGAIHFHALLRLDGVPDDRDPYPDTDIPITAEEFASAAREAAASIWADAPVVDSGDAERRMRFGAQVDARVVRDGNLDTELTPRAIAGYLAKYVTKAMSDDVDLASPHARRLIVAARDLHARAMTGEAADHYALLGRWSSALGYRGHIGSRSRRFSVTLTSLRQARAAFRSGGGAISASDDPASRAIEVSTVEVGTFEFVGMGWLSSEEAELAVEAAEAAREWRQSRRMRTDTAKGDSHGTALLHT